MYANAIRKEINSLPTCVVTKSIAYWIQCRREEMLSVKKEDMDLVEEDAEERGNCCGRCMECLGMSWRDFL